MDWKRITFFLIALILGILAAIFAQQYIHANERAINVIVTTFSILAGFLVAIMTIMGDPGAVSGKSWRYFEYKRSAVYGRLVRQKWLFIMYLATLGLIFIESLIEKDFPGVAVTIERVYLGAAVTAFVLSLGLPANLMSIQLARHEEVIESKRKAAGIKPQQ